MLKMPNYDAFNPPILIPRTRTQISNFLFSYQVLITSEMFIPFPVNPLQQKLEKMMTVGANDTLVTGLQNAFFTGYI